MVKSPLAFTLGESVDVQMPLTNAGATPALDMQVQLHLNVFTGAFPVQLPPVVFAESSSKGLCSPGHNLSTTENITISADELRAIETGFATFVIWGGCRYRDVFGDNHMTRFCYRYLPKMKSTVIASDFNEAN